VSLFDGCRVFFFFSYLFYFFKSWNLYYFKTALNLNAKLQNIRVRVNVVLYYIRLSLSSI